MAPRISDDMRRRIIRWHIEFGLSPSELATLAGCSIRNVQYILSYFRDFNTLRNPFARGTAGRPRVLNTIDINFIQSILQAQPKIYLDEIQERLLRYRKVDVSLATLSRTLRRLAISRKTISTEAAERNELLRATWQAEWGHYPAEYFVWLDEASVDDLTNQRKHGWAAMGQACVSRDTHIRGQRYSILPAMTIEGMITLDIFEGSVNKDRFISFIRNDVVSVMFASLSVAYADGI